MGKRIAITGAAGYLGQTLIAHLETQPWVERIIGIDLKPIPASSLVIPYSFDVRDSSFLRAVFAEHDITHLIHAAFIVSQPPGMTEGQMRSVNVDGSRQVFQNALGRGVDHISFISSVAVYGYRPGHPIRVRENEVEAPNMVYGQHKVEVEHYIAELTRDFARVKFAVIRPTAIVGPRGRSMSHLRALTAQPVFVLSNGGKALTQALHEEDAAAFLSQVVEHDVTGVYNVAPNDYASWADVGRLTKLPVFSMPRPWLNFATRLNNLLPALRGFTREVVDLFSESLVVDNLLARQHTTWSPRYTTREAFAQMFGAETHEKAISR